MKKRILYLLLAATICFGMMTGCGSPSDEKKGETQKQEENQDDKADAPDETDKEGEAAGDGEITEKIVLSGEYYSGKAVVNLTINPDGTAEGDANGGELTGTWKMSDEEDVYIEVNAKTGDKEMNFSVTKESDGSYSAMVDAVPGMVLTGK